jgi:hypothetical protein
MSGGLLPMAVKCEFSLLKQAHETIVYCGEQIDPAMEARYNKLSKDFLSFIATNQDSKPRWNESVEEIRRNLLQEDRDRVCKGPDYALFRRSFFLYVSDVGMTAVSNLLSHPRDPSEGDCF